MALIGCGVTTGLGAVFNRARVRAGRSVAVIGCGGIGLSVVQGCRIAGAGRIVAVDTVAWKLELAARLGATDVVNAAEGNPVPRVVEMTAGGVDYAFEAIGTSATVRQAVRMTRKGGTIVMIGVVPAGTSVELPGADIVLREKTILGCMMGSNRFRVDMPRYVELYRSGPAPARRDDLGPPPARARQRRLRSDAARDGRAERDRLRVGEESPPVAVRWEGWRLRCRRRTATRARARRP